MTPGETTNPETPDITVLVVVKNEAASIPELHERITAHFISMGSSYEIIFIDDGSTDATPKLLRELAAADENLGFIRHVRSTGKTTALMHGFDFSRGRILVCMDGDLQDQPENIARLVGELEGGQYDLVSGIRSPRNDSFQKIVVSRVFNWLVRVLLKHNFYDVNSGMKAYSRRLYKNTELQSDLYRLIPVIAERQGFRVKEMPITHSPRKSGKSKYKLLRYKGLLDIVFLMVTRPGRFSPFFNLAYMAGAALLICSIIFAVFVMLISRLGVQSELLLLLISIPMGLFLVGLFCISGMVWALLRTPPKGHEYRDHFIVEKKPPANAE